MRHGQVLSLNLIEDKDKVDAERFVARRNSNKITYDFRVRIEYKEDFIRWLEIFSSIELGISTDVKDVSTKDSNDMSYIRIKIAGTGPAREKWHDNVKTVWNFFNSDMSGDIVYLKFNERE